MHNCDFCVVPAAWGRKPYQKPVDEVIADIRQHGARKLIFVDLNLIARSRIRAWLFRALIPLRVQWYGWRPCSWRTSPSCWSWRAQRLQRTADGPRIDFAGEPGANHKGFNTPALSRVVS